jgi:hypothetical protein
MGDKPNLVPKYLDEAKIIRNFAEIIIKCEDHAEDVF